MPKSQSTQKSASEESAENATTKKAAADDSAASTKKAAEQDASSQAGAEVEAVEARQGELRRAERASAEVDLLSPLRELVVHESWEITTADEDDGEETAIRARSMRPVLIGANGESQRFLTDHEGFTQLNIRNVGPDDQAIVFLTWVQDSRPYRIEVGLVRVGHSEHVIRAFGGAKVNVTNQSEGARVTVRTSLG